MTDLYYLFLDEGKAFGELKCFILGGYIIEKTEYDNVLKPKIKDLKTDVFGNSEVVLHEIELRDKKVEPYDTLRVKETRESFWSELKNILKETNINTIGAAVHIENYKKLYVNDLSNNQYFITLQIILENFVHFLDNRNAKGVIYLESTNPTEDSRLVNHYHTIMANGTLFLHKSALQRRLTTINFSIKDDNNHGLQVADFIPNPLARVASNRKQKKPSLYDIIEDKLYDGDVGLKDRFGFKILL